ncbi:MAG: hypothetical protein NTV43_02140 [Methylococcales bacterium]|nr:hypothetical protein [Methylococcales bacterium]
MPRYTFQYLGFTDQQQEAISAILDLADSALTCDWNVIDHKDSDVIMVNLDSDEGLQLYQAELLNRPIYRIIAVSEEPTKAKQDGWFLGKKTHAPPSLKELAFLLNEVAVVLLEADKRAAEQVVEDVGTPVEIEPVTEPEIAEEVESASEAENSTEVAPASEVETSTEVAPVSEVESSTEAAPVNVVGEIASQPEPPAEPVANKTPEKPAENITEPEPVLTRPLAADNYLFGMLLQAKQDSSRRMFKLNGLAPLYISPLENCYYFDGPEVDLLRYCTLPPQAMTATIITKARLNKAIKNHKLEELSFDNLLVYAILKAAGGRLLEGHQSDRKVKLKQLPDSTKIPLVAKYRNIAQLLYKQPESLFDVAEVLQVPVSHVFDFYNICSVMGYLETTTPGKPAHSAEEQKPSALSHFLKAFFGK